MNPAEFIDKWKKTELTERSAAQQHFLDLCELLDHPKPAEVDPTGEFFTFEKGVTKKARGVDRCLTPVLAVRISRIRLSDGLHERPFTARLLDRSRDLLRSSWSRGAEELP